jgi:hypothetical protein
MIGAAGAPLADSSITNRHAVSQALILASFP